MPEMDVYNKFVERIGGGDLPRALIELQRLAHGLDSLNGLLVSPAVVGVEYVSSSDDALESLLTNYCSHCAEERTCDWKKATLHARGENYSFWLNSWPKVQFDLLDEEGRFYKTDSTIFCTHYTNGQADLPGMNTKAQQPLIRLAQIIQEREQAIADRYKSQ